MRREHFPHIFWTWICFVGQKKSELRKDAENSLRWLTNYFLNSIPKLNAFSVFANFGVLLGRWQPRPDYAKRMDDDCKTALQLMQDSGSTVENSAIERLAT